MTECACIYVDDYDQADFYHAENHIAKKAHWCCECNREIRPGEKYENASGKWDGSFETYKTCADCLSIRESFFCDGWIFQEMYGDLLQHIYDTNGEISSDYIIPLTPTARGKVCDMIQEFWDEYFDDDE